MQNKSGLPAVLTTTWVATSSNYSDGFGEHFFVHNKYRKRVICSIPGGINDDNRAIAKLIEKAPEMYAELQRIVKVCGDIPDFAKTTALVEELRKAILNQP